MRVLRYFQGEVEVFLTSGDVEKTLQRAAEHGINLDRVTLEDSLTARFWVTEKDFARMHKMLSTGGDQLRIAKKRGLPYHLERSARRPVLVLGLFAVILFFLLLPTKVLFLEVRENRNIPRAQILEIAATSGLKFGISRKQVRNEEIKNALLERIPSLSWAGINTIGCRAIITVNENAAGKEIKKEKGMSHIIASCDGIVESCTALSGSLLCQPGDVVTKGQILISGYEDHGSSIKSVVPEGEIKGKTNRKIMALMMHNETKRRSKEKEMKQWEIHIGKKYIKFPFNSGIYNATCGRMYEEYCVILPGDYQLPLSFAVNTYKTFSTEPDRVPQADAAAILKEYTEHYLKDLMLGGSILKADTVFSESKGIAVLSGQYLCREELGRIRQEKIGE